MIQDLVVYTAYIAYAIAVLMGFGIILTWVERKQSAVMSDRIGANRAYIGCRSRRSSSSGWACSTAWPTASRCC